MAVIGFRQTSRSNVDYSREKYTFLASFRIELSFVSVGLDLFPNSHFLPSHWNLDGFYTKGKVIHSRNRRIHEILELHGIAETALSPTEIVPVDLDYRATSPRFRFIPIEGLDTFL